MRALCLLRDNIAYRRDAFLAGLTASGCEIVARQPAKLGKDDVVVMWNRYGGNHELAADYERAGGKVIVTENGHLGKSWRPGSWYSMALNHHAGAGAWPYGGPSRWDSWGVEFGRWREGGSEYLIFAQRGIGEPDLRSPGGWEDKMKARLARDASHLTTRIRAHPATGAVKVPLEQDLQHAVGAVTWHSAAALAALRMGVPVWYDCPSWIGRHAGKPITALLAGEDPAMSDDLRLNVFRHVAWAMWELEEIAAGAPFKHLLELRHYNVGGRIIPIPSDIRLPVAD